MKQAVYLFLSVILTAALLLALPACGKKEPTENYLTQTDAKALAAISAKMFGKKVTTAMENYMLTCAPASGNENSPVFDGGGRSDSNGETVERRFTATLRKNGGTEPLFDILVTMKMPTALIDEAGLYGTLMARFGNKWLFSVHYTTDDNDAIFIYDAAASSLLPLGDFQTVLFFEDRLFLAPALYTTDAQRTACLVDWDGKTVASFPDVFDMTLCDDAVYLIRQHDPCVLDRLPAGILTDKKQSPQAERICDFGIYAASFYEGNQIVIQPLAGGYPTVCPIKDVLTTVQELQNGSAADSGVTEACDGFSVSLPAWWEGKYECSRTPETLTFRHKAETERGGEGFLFSLGLTDPPEDFYSAGLGGFFAFCNVAEVTDAAGNTRYLQMTYQENADDFSPENAEEAQQMLGFLNGVEYRIDVPAGSRLERIDDSDRIGSYTPDDDTTVVYRFRVEQAFHNILTCAIGFSRTEEASFWGECEATIYLYGNRGVLTWEDEENHFYGSGVAEFLDDGRVQLWLEQDDEIRDVILKAEMP